MRSRLPDREPPRRTLNLLGTALVLLAAVVIVYFLVALLLVALGVWGGA